MTTYRTAPLIVGSLLTLACAGRDVETQWTPYRRYYQLSPRSEDCNPHIAYDSHGIPPYVPIATLSFTVSGGLAGTTSDDIVNAFREQTCRIGADGVVIPEMSRQRKFLGGTASATVFMWARPPPAATRGTPTTASCSPACRSGFVCQVGSCVSACNPACPNNERCVLLGNTPTCSATPDAPQPTQQ